MKQSAILSTTLHALLMVVVMFGLPFVRPPEVVEPPSIQVDVINISDMPNAAPNNPTPSKTPPTPTPQPPVDQPPPKPELLAPTPPEAPPVPQPPKPVDIPPPPPPAPTPPKPVEVPPPPVPAPTPPKPVEPPKPDPTPKPVEKPVEPPKKEEPKKPEPPKEESKKPVEPPKQEVKKPPEPKKDDFFDMMNNAVKTPVKPTPPTPTPPKPVAGPPQQQVAQGTPAPARSQGPSNPDRPLARSEEQAILAALTPCWNPDMGMANAKEMAVEVRILLNKDGSVKNAELVDPSWARRSGQHFSAAQRALRAPMNSQCNKLPVPPGQYDSIVVVFDPKNL